jgi:hypothetical protein
LNSKWSNNAATTSVNNGLTLTSAANQGEIYASFSASQNYILETYAEETSAQAYWIAFLNTDTFESNGNFENAYTSVYDSTGTLTDNTLQKYSAGTETSLTANAGTFNLNTFYVETLSYGTSGNLEIALNYNSLGTATDTTFTSTSYVSLGVWTGATAIIQWVRTRAYPPNGVMPSISTSNPVNFPYINTSTNEDLF